MLHIITYSSWKKTIPSSFYLTIWISWNVAISCCFQARRQACGNSIIIFVPVRNNRLVLGTGWGICLVLRRLWWSNATYPNRWWMLNGNIMEPSNDVSNPCCLISRIGSWTSPHQIGFCIRAGCLSQRFSSVTTWRIPNSQTSEGFPTCIEWGRWRKATSRIS